MTYALNLEDEKWEEYEEAFVTEDVETEVATEVAEVAENILLALATLASDVVLAEEIPLNISGALSNSALCL